MALGVASSIGFGSGLHTFVLYLGPHIAFFTIKAMQCGRVDIKSAPYYTIQLNRASSWLGKDCSEFGPPYDFFCYDLLDQCWMVRSITRVDSKSFSKITLNNVVCMKIRFVWTSTHFSCST